VGHEPVTIIDEHIVVASSPGDATAHLSDPAAIAAWFGARYRTGCTTADVGGRTLEFRHDATQWCADLSAIIAEGTVSGCRFQAYLTVRGLIRVGDGGDLYESAEIWVHVEVAAARRSGTVNAIRALLRRGLDHLHLELDAAPES